VKALCIGVHVLDVLVRPVERMPEGDGELVEEIRLTAAGSAGGTALVLAKLGASVRSAGAVGSDAAGDMLISLLERDGVDASLLVRRDEVVTSASVLPIGSDGRRPAWHVIGANGAYGFADVDLAAVEAADFVHLGGPEFMGGEDAARVLSHAREHGAVTSIDVLAPGEPGLLDWIAPALEHAEYVLPNEEQVLGFTGASSVAEGSRALLARGARCVVATLGAEGVLIDGEEAVPAVEVDVVDTTGCGDAFTAGFLYGLASGRDRRAAAELGCAVAARVAGGLGTDAGGLPIDA
jgi:sugar/nucleoside kinase (ribokinase family)